MGARGPQHLAVRLLASQKADSLSAKAAIDRSWKILQSHNQGSFAASDPPSTGSEDGSVER